MSRDQIIRDTAYAIWEAEGKPEGRAAEHWRQAEARIDQSLKGNRGTPSESQSAKPAGRKPKPKAPLKAAATAMPKTGAEAAASERQWEASGKRTPSRPSKAKS
jgi:hypothetical protein